jgi:aspartate carbamoyltransferase regulatory subunit
MSADIVASGTGNSDETGDHGQNGTESHDRFPGKKHMKVTPINNGIVIDHITPGRGIFVLDLLGLPDLDSGSVVSAVLNVPTQNGLRKDIIKIEGKNLGSQELDIISLIAPEATINIIENTEVVKKHRVQLPDLVCGIVRCINPNCITNQREPVESNFSVVSKDPVVLRCSFCERKTIDIPGQIIR